jgi:hypothetical protein
MYEKWISGIEALYGKSIRQTIHLFVEKLYALKAQGIDIPPPVGKIEEEAATTGLKFYEFDSIERHLVADNEWKNVLFEPSEPFDAIQKKCGTLLYNYAASCSLDEKWSPIDFDNTTMDQQVWCRRVACFAAKEWQDGLISRLRKYSMDESSIKALHFSVNQTMMGYTNYLNKRGISAQQVQLPKFPVSFIEREASLGSQLTYLALPNHSSDLKHSTQHNPILGHYLLHAHSHFKFS